MKANPLTTTTIAVNVPVSLDLAAEVSAAGKGGSPQMAALCAHLGHRIVTAHERSPFPLSASLANVSTSSSTG